VSTFLTSLHVHLPVIHAWSEKQETVMLATGTPLNESQLADALRARVAFPEKIRVIHVETLPQPDSEDLMFIARQIGLFSSRSVGLSLGYGIAVQHDFCADRLTLVHEYVHVGQHERKGGLLPYLTDYLRECIDPGFPFGALEQEAILVSREICKTGEHGGREKNRLPEGISSLPV